MMMRLISPRRTAPYQTLDSSSRITSPSTVAPGTTHALEWIVGPLFKRGTMPACPIGSESGLICIRRSVLDVQRLMFDLQLTRILSAFTESDVLISASERLYGSHAQVSSGT